jgi:sialate O-acetylesterase
MRTAFYSMRIFMFFVFLIGSVCGAKAQLRLPRVFSDNMILQRGKPILVWGYSKAASWITVDFAGKRHDAIAGKDGRWNVQLPSMKAGGPYVMSVFERDREQQALKFKNVLIGDVWIASGQSNMEWQVSQSANAAQEIRKADHPEIRFFIVPHAKQVNPQDTLAGGSWISMDTVGVKTASAVAYYFARSLHESLEVPIGIIQSTWGGTPVEAWTSREKLLESSITKKQVLQNDTVQARHFIKDSLDLVRFWDIVYKPDKQVLNKVTQLEYNDQEWHTADMPKMAKDMNLHGFEGIVWLRKAISVSAAVASNKHLSIELGRPEMNYSLYINGQEIAKTVWNANLSHKYTVPPGLLKHGRNVIAIRMAFLWGGGGFNPTAEGINITDGKIKVDLAGAWKLNKDLEPRVPAIRNYHRYPSYLYNAMINPIIPYGTKGFIWYQGEDNASAPAEYRSLFPMMIKDWRTRWGQGDLPFLYVQLANYMKRSAKPEESDWATLREAQTMTLAQPNTGMAVIIDIGAADDIHPKNKQEVGRRLALLAKKQVYQQDLQAQSPIYMQHKIEGSKVRIIFKETGLGLKTSDGEQVKGFAIAGADGNFQWAEGSVDGSSVIVSASGVTKPIAVRYAWSDNPECNLINSAGLPAVPFRSDVPRP